MQNHNVYIAVNARNIPQLLAQVSINENNGREGKKGASVHI